MTVTLMQGLEWELGKQMLTLVELNVHDQELSEEIWKGIDCEHDEKLLPDSLTGSTSKKNQGGSSIPDCMSQNTAH